MKPRLSTVALAVLVQAGLAQAQAQAQQSSESTPAAQASEPSLARQSIEWSQTRLTELDAAIAVFEQNLAKRNGNTRAKVEVALQELKGKRDAYRAEAEAAAAQAKIRSEQELAQARQSLDDSWTALQGTKDRYLDTVQADVATRRAVLQAEFDARQKAWQEAIDGLSADAAAACRYRGAHRGTQGQSRRGESPRRTTAGRFHTGLGKRKAELCRSTAEFRSNLFLDSRVDRRGGQEVMM